MQYQPKVKTSAPETLTGLQPGQWIDYNGTRGRWMGRRNGVIWIAWARASTIRFTIFANAYNGRH